MAPIRELSGRTGRGAKLTAGLDWLARCKRGPRKTQRDHTTRRVMVAVSSRPMSSSSSIRRHPRWRRAVLLSKSLRNGTGALRCIAQCNMPQPHDLPGSVWISSANSEYSLNCSSASCRNRCTARRQHGETEHNTTTVRSRWVRTPRDKIKCVANAMI